MNLRKLNIFALALLALSMFLPAGLNAQSAAELLADRDNENSIMANYGANPYDDPEAEGAIKPDSAVVEERRLRRPLESYFFSDSVRALDNFSWCLESRYNRVDIEPLDTTLYDWRIDYPYQKKGVGDMSLGGLGQASQPINFFDRQRYEDFEFAQGFDAYLFDMENVKFYNSKRPFSQMTYLEAGQKTFRESNFGIIHAQNITPSTGFNVEYNAHSTRGQYYRQDTKNHNLSTAIAHTGKRYSIHAGYINNKIVAEENGGVVDVWAIRDSIFDMPIGVPMKLGDAEASNVYRNNVFYVQQSYGIPLQRVTDYDFSLAPLTAVYVGHSFEYNKWSKSYRDVKAPYTDDRGERNPDGSYTPVEGEYYDNWFINPVASRDSLYERRISNRFFVQAQPWDRDGVVGTIDGGIGIDMHAYSQFNIEDYASGKMSVEKQTSWYAYGKVSGKVSRFVDWGANAEIYPSGYRGGDFSLGGDITLKGSILRRPLLLKGAFSTSTKSPTYWQQTLYTNHFIWANDFNKESQTRLGVSFQMPDNALELGFNQAVLGDKIYYNSSSEVAQSSEVVSVTGAYARKDFRIGGLHLDHKLLAQWSSDDELVPLPLFSGYLSYYYEFWVVKNVLRMQMGLDCRLTTKYYMPSYNPAISQFYNQREVELGNYPYTDLFVTAKWKRMRIFLKYQHLNNNLYGNGEYFTTAYYPQNPGMFKMGISWGFYD